MGHTRVNEKLKNTENKVKMLMSDILSSIGNLKAYFDATGNEEAYNTFKYLTDYVCERPAVFLEALETSNSESDTSFNFGFNGTIEKVELNGNEREDDKDGRKD